MGYIIQVIHKYQGATILKIKSSILFILLILGTIISFTETPASAHANQVSKNSHIENTSKKEINVATNQNTNTYPSDPSKSNPPKKTDKQEFNKVVNKFIGKRFSKYQTQFRTNSKTNYKIYATGGYNTTAGNKKPVATSKAYRGRLVTVSGHETTTDKLGKSHNWSKVSVNTHRLGWINTGALDNHQRRLIGVPLIGQRPQLPTGCEITSVTMMLNYAGDHSSKTTLANQMPRSSNPNKGFVGSPYSKSGWYIYPKGLMPLVKKHLGSARNLTGAGQAALRRSINRNHPVVIWLAPLDGFSNHALTITGYTRYSFKINDPWRVKRITMSNTRLQRLWRNDAYRALSY